jgi:hypothetical protein
MGHRELGAVERAVERDGEHPAPLVKRELLDPRVGGVAGVVDQDLQPAKCSHGRLDHPLDLSVVGDVGLDGEGSASQRFNLANDSLSGLRATEIVYDDVAALAS